MRNATKALFEEPEKIRIFSPAGDACPECGAAHEPREPHYRNSLTYLMRFLRKNGRMPTWADAMRHCAKPVRDIAVEKLREKGVPEEEIFGKGGRRGG